MMRVPDDSAREDLPRVGTLAQIRISVERLSDAERRVARAFLDDAPGLIDLSVEAMAERIGVSSATIVRFCQSFGFRGIRDFKLALASDVLGDHVRDLPQAIGFGDSVVDIARKILKSDEDAIIDTRQVLDESSLNRAVEALIAASRIEFIGLGSSMPIAMDACFRFARIGLTASYMTDPYMQRVACAFLDPGAVAFAISHTGRTRDTHRSFEAAKERGATCILLTSNRGTPIGELADIEIVAASRETAFRTEAMSSRIAHLSLIDALYVAVAMRTVKAPEAMQRWDTLFSDIRY